MGALCSGLQCSYGARASLEEKKKRLLDYLVLHGQVMTRLALHLDLPWSSQNDNTAEKLRSVVLKGNSILFYFFRNSSVLISLRTDLFL